MNINKDKIKFRYICALIFMLITALFLTFYVSFVPNVASAADKENTTESDESSLVESDDSVNSLSTTQEAFVDTSQDLSISENDSANNITNISYDKARDDASFAVNYSNGSKATFHYGYVDTDGDTYYMDSLPSVQPNDLSRDALGTGQSQNNVFFQHFVQEISLGERADKQYYTYQCGYAFGDPTSSTAKICEGISLDTSNWYYISRTATSSWSSGPSVSSSNDVDVYFIFKAQNSSETETLTIATSSSKANLTIKPVSITDGVEASLPEALTTISYPALSSGGTFYLQDMINKHIVYDKNGNAFTFKGVYKNSSSGTSLDIYQIQFSISGRYTYWKYNTYKSETYNTLQQSTSTNKPTLYAVYEPADIGLDMSDKGIKMNMFNYDAWKPSTESTYYWAGISKGYSDFWFGSTLPGFNAWSSSTDNHVTNDNFKRLLQNNNPVLNKSLESSFPKYHVSNTDLSYLFDPDNTIADDAGYRTTYRNCNNFFDRDIYEKTGHYYYSSNKDDDKGIDGRFSSFDRQAKRFILYNTYNTYNARRFMPYDYGVTTSTTLDNKSIMHDYLYSLTFDFDFMQPKDGYIQWKEQSPEMMQFEFNGDDDVFVYVDDILLLDIGGLHAALPGEINFATGQITRASNVGSSEELDQTSIIDMYCDASGLTPDQSTYDELVNDGIFKEVTYENKTGYTYPNYGAHNMKIYYMERGEGDSNAKFDFNLASMPEGSIQVGKEITEDKSHISHTDEEYEFYTEVATKPSSDFSAYSGHYIVYEGSVGQISDTKVKEGDTTNGIVKIKAGQVAVLQGVNQNMQYRTYEYDQNMDATTDPSALQGYKWDFNINEQYYKPFYQKTIDGKTYFCASSDGGVSPLNIDRENLAGLQFKNSYNTETYNLKIERKDSLSDVASTQFQVAFNNQNYNGKCDIYNSDGTLYQSDVDVVDGVVDYALSYDDSKYILIPGVEMNVPVTVNTYDSASKAMTNNFTSSQFANVSTSGYTFDADIPSILSPNDDYFSTVVLHLSKFPNNDISITKDASGDYADKTRQFDIDLNLYTDDSQPYTPGSSSYYEGSYVRQSGATENLKIAVLDGTEGSGDAGSVKIVTYDSEGQIVYSNFKLASGDKISLKSILPYEGCISVNEENVYENFASGSTNYVPDKINIAGGDIEFSLNPDKSRWMSGVSNKVSSALSFTVVNELSNAVPTGFNIDNIFWIFILIACIIAASCVAYKLYKKRYKPKHL